MHAYLRAATRGDSTTLLRITLSPQPIHWATGMQQRAPQFLTEAAEEAHVQWVYLFGDTVAVSFRLPRGVADPGCPYRPLDNLQGRFLRGIDGTWRIAGVGVDIC